MANEQRAQVTDHARCHDNRGTTQKLMFGGEGTHQGPPARRRKRAKESPRQLRREQRELFEQSEEEQESCSLDTPGAEWTGDMWSVLAPQPETLAVRPLDLSK